MDELVLGRLSKHARPGAEEWGRTNIRGKEPWEETQEKPSEIGGNREKNVENQGECIIYKKDGVGNGVKYPWEVWSIYSGLAEGFLLTQTIWGFFFFFTWQCWWEKGQCGAAIPGSQQCHTICKLFNDILHISSLEKPKWGHSHIRTLPHPL